jgi:hypothetical protein
MSNRRRTWRIELWECGTGQGGQSDECVIRNRELASTWRDGHVLCRELHFIKHHMSGDKDFVRVRIEAGIATLIYAVT